MLNNGSFCLNNLKEFPKFIRFKLGEQMKLLFFKVKLNTNIVSTFQKAVLRLLS